MNENKLLHKNLKKTRSLNEWVDRNLILDSIKEHDILYIYYAGDETVNRGYRTIEPFVLGKHVKTGNLVLRAWQQAGSSDSAKGVKRTPREKDKLAGWRLFRLDGITTAMKTSKKFKTDSAFISSKRPKFNPEDRDIDIMFGIEPDHEIGVDDVGTSTSIDSPKTTRDFKGQDDKFKSFFQSDKNKDTINNENIRNIYELITKYHKKNPRDYSLMKRGGDFFAVKNNNVAKYPQNNVVGNLKDIFNDRFNVDSSRLKPNFLKKEKDDFFNKMKNYSE